MKIDYKVKGGKLLRINFNINDNKITDFKLSGDFFIYPENEIDNIESILVGKKYFEISNILESYLEKNKITIIGFSPNDVQNAVKEVINKK